ncbi:hypothetical protein PGT21_036983 [Puccinia graminis f. sp. tritici]|uniref:SWIM-type domain-containing protein n=1 Tax=Puccinia graminis f. sp. tritici TaxID=56615 RepID=A0A5B0QRK6_PUCGR|nr:hypothetical protein PGT21_036983 [Puccinia graminis f. sp. tritici]
MHFPFLIIGLVPATWCMKQIMKLEADETGSKSIQELASSSTPPFQGLAANDLETRASKRQKLMQNPQYQVLDSNEEQGASSRKNIAHYVQSQNFNCACEPKGHCRSVFQRLIQDSHLLKYLPPRKASILSKFWEINHDQVISLDKDWEEVLGIQLQIKKCSCDHFSSKNLCEHVEIRTKTVRDLFERLKDKMLVLKDVRLMELGGLYSSKNHQKIISSLCLEEDQNEELLRKINDVPEPLVDDIRKSTWESFSYSILEEMKKLIINHKSSMIDFEFYDRSSVPSGKYFLKVLASFYKEKLIGEKVVSSFLYDKALIKKVLECALDSFIKERELVETPIMYMWYSLESIMKHWYNPFTHYFFKGFDTMEQRILEVHSLSEKILQFGDISIRHSNAPKDWHQKMNSILIKEYSDHLEELLNGSNKITRLSDNNLKMQTYSNHDARKKVEDGVKILTEILQSLIYPTQVENKPLLYENLLSIAICQILRSTEINCNGIVQEMEKKIIPQILLTGYRLSKGLIIQSSIVYKLYTVLKILNASFVENRTEIYDKNHQVRFSTVMEKCQEKLKEEIPLLQNICYKLYEDYDSPAFSFNVFKEITHLVMQVERGDLDEEIELSITHLKTIRNDPRFLM